MRQLLICILCFAVGALSLPVRGEDAGAQEAVKAAVGADGVQRVSIIGGSYFFKPNHIVVKARVPVAFSVEKEQGIVPHSFVIQAPEAGIAVEEEIKTEPKIITFTATAPGSYEFYCKHKLPFLPSHREKGMKGILEVVE